MHTVQSLMQSVSLVWTCVGICTSKDANHQVLYTYLFTSLSFVSFHTTQDDSLVNFFTTHGSMENNWTLCGNVCYPTTSDPCIFGWAFSPTGIPEIQALHLGIFKWLPGSCWCFHGNWVIGKGDLNGGCQRGKLSAATGIHFALWEFTLKCGSIISFY